MSDENPIRTTRPIVPVIGLEEPSVEALEDKLKKKLGDKERDRDMRDDGLPSPLQKEIAKVQQAMERSGVELAGAGGSSDGITPGGPRRVTQRTL